MGKRSLEVLRGVDLDVARGEFLALRGASGAGKSTLLHLIGGLDSPNAGEILFDGQNLVTFSERKLTEFRNRRVGFIFQAYHLLPELDALENVCLPARMARISVATVEARGRELLTRVGLKDRLDHKPSELSGGEIIELLKSLRVEKNTTLVIATHDAKVAANAERVIELVDGRIS